MTTGPQQGDVLIRAFTHSTYQLLDAMTHRQIAIIGNLEMAVAMAAEHGGAVWRENVDNRGRALGGPVLLLARRSAPQA